MPALPTDPYGEEKIFEVLGPTGGFIPHRQYNIPSRDFGDAGHGGSCVTLPPSPYPCQILWVCWGSDIVRRFGLRFGLLCFGAFGVEGSLTREGGWRAQGRGGLRSGDSRRFL